MTPRSPLVSPDFTGCHVPVDRRQRRARQRGLIAVTLDHWPAVRLLVDLLNFDGPKFIDQTGGHKPFAERLAFLDPFECCDLVLLLGEFYSDQRVAAAALVLVERPIGNPHSKAISNNLPGLG